MKKKYIYIIISMMIIVIFSGCEKKDEKVKIEHNFDIDMAMEVGKKYIENISTGNYDLNDKLYSKELLDKNKKVENLNLKITSYKVEELVEVGKVAEMKILIANTDLTKAYSSVDEIKLKIVKENSQYKIEKIDSVLQKEIFPIKRGLRLKDKDEVKTNLVVDMKGIPNFAISSEDHTKMNKVTVPKKEFNSILLACSGEKVALSTFDKNSFIGIVDIDEAKATEANTEENAQNEASNDGGEVDGKPEIPIGRNLKSLDILKNSKVEFMSFSQDGEFLIVQYKDMQGESIILYDIEKGETISFDFKKQYKLDKVDVVFKSLEQNSIIYEVKAQSGIDVNDSQVRYSIGKWKLDLKKFKAEKVN